MLIKWTSVFLSFSSIFLPFFQNFLNILTHTSNFCPPKIFLTSCYQYNFCYSTLLKLHEIINQKHLIIHVIKNHYCGRFIKLLIMTFKLASYMAFFLLSLYCLTPWNFSFSRKIFSLLVSVMLLFWLMKTRSGDGGAHEGWFYFCCPKEFNWTINAKTIFSGTREIKDEVDSSGWFPKEVEPPT